MHDPENDVYRFLSELHTMWLKQQYLLANTSESDGQMSQTTAMVNTLRSQWIPSVRAPWDQSRHKWRHQNYPREATSFKVNGIFSNPGTISSSRCQNTSIICNKIYELEFYSHIIVCYFTTNYASRFYSTLLLILSHA